jgi:RimJ/RimL family protein N-acetyltransferase
MRWAFDFQEDLIMIDGTLVSLRAREPTDAATILPWLNDPEVKRYLGGRYPWSLAAEQEWLRQRTAKPIDFNELSLVIETRDGRAIGTVGLGGITPENREATLGIMIGAKDCWSRGYGTDAILALLRFAFGEMNLHRVQLEVFGDNARGIACYRKCGFVEEARLRQDRYRLGSRVDALVMGVLKSEFEALHGLTAKEAVDA